MSIYLNTNIPALMAQRQLGLTQARLDRTHERLSTGYRINRGADDAAGLAISERMRARIRGLQTGMSSAQNGISMVQTADGALSEVNDILGRMKELALQAGSDTLSAEEREAIGAELVTLKDEINNIANRTSFNGLSLLKGSRSIATVSSIGPIADGSDDDAASVAIDVSRAQADVTYSLTISGSDVTVTNSVTGASQTLTVAEMSGDGGSQGLNFDELGVKLTLSVSQGAGGDGTMSAADLAAGLDGESIATTGDDGAANFRLSGDASDHVSVLFNTDMRAWALGNGGSEDLADLIQDETAVSTVDQADTLLSAVDAAIGQVSGFRTRLGASENQLDHAINSLRSGVENLTATESRIRDADFAAETSRQTSLEVQRDAIIALLAQANTYPKSALRLLTFGT